ncbi:4Fe-4S single cluster domain-containing protein [uncultured Adlercreutzia sp.]|uniref:4Fe-4S single cluster domain-containing protein n=1 Tax=uncultured Adlercreutzia sp. TaxID=875803 RepID=UPI0026F405BF|nr:4Fe-4S single cluster domain-containing protein [uncultured Adlercreutzia sp.]
MFVDRLYYPVSTLGPGQRIALWTRGCSKHCSGCANPELWEAAADAYIENEKLADILLDLAARTGTHRLTVTGGDPLEQADDLAQVLATVRPAFDDILVYTGYILEGETAPRRGVSSSGAPPARSADDLSEDETPLRGAVSPRGSVSSGSFRLPDALDPLIDVVIDGPYVEALNDGICGLRGSANQRLIVRNPALEKLYHEEERKPRRVQNAVFDGRAISIGIHGRPA